MNKLTTMPRQREALTSSTFALNDIPARNGSRPLTFRGPLHIQGDGHGDSQYLNQLVDDVLEWPHVESTPPSVNRSSIILIRLKEFAAVDDSSIFLSPREFARVLLGAPTIYLALPLACAHWAILRGWAEPHYLGSFGLMPAGAVLVYTPRDREELSVCNSLFLSAYHSVCKVSSGDKGAPNQQA
jgi:hypothetical protein